MKYKLLKAIDVAGLNFLRPVILLCYGEEPDKQFKEIGLFIIIPVVAFLAFLYAWSTLAPLHKTKSGEVPTPGVVWDAAKGIWGFHAREGDKAHAYELSGEDREERLLWAKNRLEALKPLEKEANAQASRADLLKSAYMEELTSPWVEEIKSMKKNARASKKERIDALKRLAASIPSSDKQAKDAYLEKYREHLAITETESKAIKSLQAKEDAIRSKAYPERQVALKAQTAIAEEKQYLVKLISTLEGGRDKKLEAAQAKLNKELGSFYDGEGEGLYKLAMKISRSEGRIRNIETSSYAKPMTLPDQILRSIACVFAGFVIASMIAIPIGMICGLSRICMSALTPFIALFKPVSPIVWLPIFFIIVGGFIPEPDKHWLMSALAGAPLVGWMKINPAFIASALTVAMCSLWPTLVNTALGVASIDKDHINVARVLRLGFKSRLLKIVIPSSLPLVFAGLRISLGVGWMVLIAAELLSSSEGLGKFVWDMFNNGSSLTFAQMFVVVFVVGIVGLILDRIMIVFQRLVSFDGAPTAL